MKQEEKNRKSREHILEYAFGEFAQQGYQGASVNTICAAGKISKGLLYHYYPDKDSLYLACVEKCYGDLTSALHASLDVQSITPEQYFDTRFAFFRDHPQHQRLFCDTIANPPAHLLPQLRNCQAGFNRLKEALVTAILERERLAEGITLADAICQFRVIEDCVSIYLKNLGPEPQNAETHSKLYRQTFQTMLYGLIARS